MRRILALACILIAAAPHASAQSGQPEKINSGVWFLVGDASKGYSNTVVIEMRDYLIVVDANYPGRAHELLAITKELSPKPVRYVFDTHAHGDHSYGNSVWTSAGATTVAFAGVTSEMNRWEPTAGATRSPSARICKRPAKPTSSDRRCPSPATS